MAGKVVSSIEAVNAIRKFKELIGGDLLNNINSLNAQGQILSSPENWDGPLAEQFREGWSETHSHLMKMKSALEELQNNINTINKNILDAGGLS
ncbi:WXG100 family type VII secretion target [Herpetosiphon gulosus]|uniref:Pyrophosphorylase n=1 Tax=Herpetosiphon gulosus TaxID=1973496 RepID=A0ABP9X784_9CHLR